MCIRDRSSFIQKVSAVSIIDSSVCSEGTEEEEDAISAMGIETVVDLSTNPGSTSPSERVSLMGIGIVVDGPSNTDSQEFVIDFNLDRTSVKIQSTTSVSNSQPYEKNPAVCCNAPLPRNTLCEKNIGLIPVPSDIASITSDNPMPGNDSSIMSKPNPMPPTVCLHCHLCLLCHLCHLYLLCYLLLSIKMH